MAEKTERFEVLMEPTDRWLVWDKVNDTPAEHSGSALFGLSHSEALMHCEMLNEAELARDETTWRFDCRIVHAGPRNRRPGMDADELQQRPDHVQAALSKNVTR